jgi:D-lactate dehydrogenase
VMTRSGGHDHIDAAECTRRGVSVANIAGADDNTVTEHTFALILALSRRLLELREANKQPRFRYEALRGFDLMDKTLGVVGTGRIGLRVVRIALAFGMKVLACDPHNRSLMAEILGLRYVPLDELLRESHVVTLHAPLSDETRGLLNRESLALCRRGVLVVNTARGGLIDTAALDDALESGQVAGAGLDVLEDEAPMQKEIIRIAADQIIARLQRNDKPQKSSPDNLQERVAEIGELYRSSRLLSRPNVVFTPHVAFNSIEAVERIDRATIESIRAFLAGKPIPLVQPQPPPDPQAKTNLFSDGYDEIS